MCMVFVCVFRKCSCVLMVLFGVCRVVVYFLVVCFMCLDVFLWVLYVFALGS